MFNNLIESSSHRNEFKRRGSFFLFTIATYALVFTITGVVSIYAYDARLEDQTYEVVTMLPPQDLPPQETVSTNKPHTTAGSRSNVTERAIAMLSVNHPEVVPKGVSTQSNKNLPLPENAIVTISGRDVDPDGPAGNPGAVGVRKSAPTQVVVVMDTPPPAEPSKPKPEPKVISKGVITGLATYLPKPGYPPLAKQIRLQGSVSVQVLIDETGKVISAKGVVGHPMLLPEAVKAAYQARFSPTLLSEKPVKVSGVITYNFVIQ